MIDLTPLDVRKKRDDFRKTLRGYDPADVDTFLELVAERMEELVKENLTLRERTDRLQEQVSSQMGRERAVQEALVTAQELRDDIRGQARQEAEEILVRAEKEAGLLRKEAEAEAEEIVARASRQLEARGEALQEVERKRVRFLRAFRALLEREMDVVEVEEGRAPLEEATVDLDFGGGPTPTASARARGDEPVAIAGRTGSEATSGVDRPEGVDGLRLVNDPLRSDERVPEGTAAPESDGGDMEEGPESDLDVGHGGSPEATPSDEREPSAEGDLSAETESAPVHPAAPEEADPKRWLSSLVEHELNEKTDEEPWS